MLLEVSAPYSLEVACLDNLLEIERIVDSGWEKQMDGSFA